jgi:hypothetical protein
MCDVWRVTCDLSHPPPDHMAYAHVPKVTPLPLRRRQFRNPPVEIKSQVVAVAAPPKEFVEFEVSVDGGRLMREYGDNVTGGYSGV